MLFSVNYKSQNKSSADEIRCPFNQLGLIFDFIKEHPEKRYNIIISDTLTEVELNKAIEQINYVKEVANNYTIECGNVLMLYTLLNKGYNAYLRFPVNDWETFHDLVKLGVSDIYIDGVLGFSVSRIKQGKENVLIRVSPTISPNAAINSIRRVNTFFIRPEDLHLYSSAIDIIDFHEQNQEAEDALYSIYTRGTFNFKLNDLIKNLDEDINNLLIQSEFAEARLNCKQKCKVPGYRCCHCTNYFNILRHSLELANISY